MSVIAVESDREPGSKWPGAAPVLEARGVFKAYGEAEVLRGVDLALERGERVGLMGPSGSGKSTLLHCLGGIDRPDRGEVLLEGEPIHDGDGGRLALLRREKISSVFQFFHLLPTLTVYENIEFPLRLTGCPAEERRERVETLLKEVRLESRRDGHADELSGGEMQRVAIARALAVRPRVILADEPTGNLDSVTGEAILGLLETLTDRYETALLLVTHSEAATRICGRTLQMKDGRMAL